MITILDIFKVVGGGIVGASLAHVLAVWRDRAGCRRVYKGYARSVIAEFDALSLGALKPGELFARHQATIAGIRTECAKAFDSIRWYRRSKFEAAWVAYSGLRLEEVEPHDIGTYPDGDHEKFSYPERFDLGRKRITELLKQTVKYAK